MSSPSRDVLFWLSSTEAAQSKSIRHILWERGPTHPFLCDVKSSFDLFISPTLNSALSQKGSIVLIVFNRSGPIKILYWSVYHKGGGGGGGGGDPLTCTCATSKQVIISKSCFCSMVATCMNLRLWSAVFREKTNLSQAVNRNNNF